MAGERKLWKPALVLAVLIAFSKTVSVCTLSDGRAGWTDPGTHCRIFGKPAGSLAHGKKRELPGGCLTGGNEYA